MAELISFVVHKHLPRHGSVHYDLRFNDPKKTGELYSFAFGKDFPTASQKRIVGVLTKKHKGDWLTKEGYRLEIYDDGKAKVEVATGKYFEIEFQGKRFRGNYKLFTVKSKRGDNWVLVKMGEE